MAARNSLRAVAVLALLVIALPRPALAAAPTEELRGAIDKVITILKKPELKAKKAERRDQLRGAIKPVFDFEEISKRSLGVNWNKRTDAERKEFVTLFTELLENSYLGKIESYNGEKIRYAKETLNSPYAEVDTFVVTKGNKEVPINYRMHTKDGRWMIYDVVIEGVSLVNNYRSQFASILQRSDFNGLIAKLRTTAKGGGG